MTTIDKHQVDTSASAMLDEKPAANTIPDRVSLQLGACGQVAMAARLRKSGLRPTRQRVALGCLLYARGHRHVSAEMLHDEAIAAKFPVSLATVYNTLHQFTETGLLREIAVEGARTYFDTNTSQHHHFFIEGENRLIDIDGDIAVDNIPEPPTGMHVESFQVIVRVRANT